MKNVIIKALENAGNTDLQDMEFSIMSVKFSKVENNQATYFALMIDVDDRVYYINEIYLDVEKLEAEFAPQSFKEGSFDEMNNKFNSL